MIRNKIDGIINSITNKINSKVSYLIDTFSIVINILIASIPIGHVAG